MDNKTYMIRRKFLDILERGMARADEVAETERDATLDVGMVSDTLLIDPTQLRAACRWLEESNLASFEILFDAGFPLVKDVEQPRKTILFSGLKESLVDPKEDYILRNIGLDYPSVVDTYKNSEILLHTYSLATLVNLFLSYGAVGKTKRIEVTKDEDGLYALHFSPCHPNWFRKNLKVRPQIPDFFYQRDKQILLLEELKEYAEEVYSDAPQYKTFLDTRQDDIIWAYMFNNLSREKELKIPNSKRDALYRFIVQMKEFGGDKNGLPVDDKTMVLRKTLYGYHATPKRYLDDAVGGRNYILDTQPCYVDLKELAFVVDRMLSVPGNKACLEYVQEGVFINYPNGWDQEGVRNNSVTMVEEHFLGWSNKK